MHFFVALIVTYLKPSSPRRLPGYKNISGRQTRGLGTAIIGRMVGYKGERIWLEIARVKIPQNTAARQTLKNTGGKVNNKG